MSLRLKIVDHLAALLTIAILTNAKADIINVPGDQPTIQAGIRAAINGDEVVVADGIYAGAENRNLDFTGKLITVRSENGPANCIIDCELAARGFIFQNAETNDSRLEGFTILRGRAHLVSFTYMGGSIFCIDSSPTIVNCVFEDSGVGPGPGFGGAICCASNSNPVIIDCTFINNWTDIGGGAIACADSSTPTIINCLFDGNMTFYGGPTQGGGGGGVWCGDSSAATITDCIFIGNSSSLEGGGVCCLDTASVLICNSTFIGNLSEQDGGAVATNMVSDIEQGNGPSVLIDSCTMNSNFSMQDGGAIYVHNSGNAPTIINCTLTENTAVHLGGGIRVFENNPTIVGCNFNGNSADFGGGIHNVFSNTSIINCQFVGNSATMDGGGIINKNSEPIIRNCTFVENTAGQYGAGITNDQEASATIDNCLFLSNSAVSDGGGMFNRYSSHPLITNCQFIGNLSGANGGAMHTRTGLPRIINTVFRLNSANLGGVIYAWDDSQIALSGCTLLNNTAIIEGNETYNIEDSSVIISNSIIRGSDFGHFGGPGVTTVLFSNVQGGYVGLGNIDADPMFVDPDIAITNAGTSLKSYILERKRTFWSLKGPDSGPGPDEPPI
ncbi:MAG: hypothetical protein IH984_10140 [Planctomycetes bacterium]|nr:hypothetical protein [Planctomycetota bacterium]